MRLASGLLLLVAVAFTWLAAAELFASTWPRVLAAGSVALIPQLTSISGTINADIMLVAAWSGFLFAALRLIRRGPTTKRVVAVCAFAVASLLTHGRGVAIAFPLLVVLAITVLRTRPSLGEAVRWLAPGVGLVVASFGAYQLLLTPEAGAYGGEVTLGGPASKLSPLGFLNVTWQFYFPRLPFMDLRIGPEYGYRQVFVESFFGRFASLEVSYPRQLYDLIQGACALGIAGLAAATVACWQAVRAKWASVVVVAATAVALIGLLHAASYRALVFSNDPLITGRYLLPIAAVFGLTVAFVITSLRPRASAVLGTLVLSGLLALNLGGLMLTFTRFYG
jgi:hypothetical protein